MSSHRRHDISDKVWEFLAPHLPGGAGRVGRPALDNRLFINAVFWILRTGAPWRDLPPDYGHWKNVQRRFCLIARCTHMQQERRGVIRAWVAQKGAQYQDTSGRGCAWYAA
jgi:transposase